MERDIAPYNCDGELLQWIDRETIPAIGRCRARCPVRQDPHWPRQAHHARAYARRVEALIALRLQGNEVLLSPTSL